MASHLISRPPIPEYISRPGAQSNSLRFIVYFHHLSSPRCLCRLYRRCCRLRLSQPIQLSGRTVKMLLFWAAYALLYATALQWSHLNALGSSYIRSIPVRLGRRPAIEASRFFLSAGLPLANTSATPISIEIPSSTPTSTPPAPTSSRIPIPGTIIFPASPLPTARLPHQALPLCYDGLHDDMPPTVGSRTVTGITTDLIADGPGLFMRYFLVTSTLASTLIDNLVRSPACCALICVLALVWVSCVLFVMRRGAFKAAAGCTRVSV